MAAKLALAVVSIPSYEDGWGGVQNTGSKGRGHAKLLLNGQLQVPNRPQRQKYDQDVRYDIDDTRDDKVEGRVDAGTRDGSIPCPWHGVALEDDRKHVGEVKADIQPDKDLEEPEYKTTLGGYEDPHKLK